MKMKQIKLFEDINFNGLQDTVNKWLSDNHIDVIDIKFATSKYDGLPVYTLLVVYEKEKMENDKLEMIEEFKHYCIVCHKKIMLMCGQPSVTIAGCCVGVVDEEDKTLYLRVLKAHLPCYNEYVKKHKKSPKLKFTMEDVRKIMRKENGRNN